jgi:hypothetical protein
MCTLTAPLGLLVENFFMETPEEPQAY